MKKIFSILMGVALIASLSSCGGSDEKAVAEKFLNHLNKMEYDEAKALGTKETGEFLDMMKQLSAMGGEAAKEAAAKKEPVKIKDSKVEGDKAVVTYCCDDKGADATVNMVKQDGKWLVEMKKEQPSMNEDEVTEEPAAEGDSTEAK
jgi:hypothetical protein